MAYQVRNGGEYYTEDAKHNELYKVVDGAQVYARNANDEEYYAKHVNVTTNMKEDVYARDADQNQYYAAHQGYIVKNGNQIYAEANDGTQRYFRENGKDVVAKVNGKLQYALDAKQTPYYPSDENEDQYIAEEGGTLLLLGPPDSIQYPLDKKGRPLYTKDDDGNELYTPSIAEDADGRQYYARKANGDEYYPEPKYLIITDKNLGYALTHDGKLIYPKNSSGDEYYLHIPLYTFATDYDDLFFIALSDRTAGYAKTHDHDQIYPKKKEFDIEYEVPIPMAGYAQLHTGKKIYPLDAYHNEYPVPNQPKQTHYPVTNDGYLIVPNVNGVPKFRKGNDDATHENIIGMLYRKNLGSDYLTDVKAKRAHLRPKERRKYHHYPLKFTVQEKAPVMGWWMWLLAPLVVLILVVVFFVVRK